MFYELSLEAEQLKADVNAGLVSQAQLHERTKEIMLAAGGGFAGYLSLRMQFVNLLGLNLSTVLELLSAHLLFAWSIQRKVNQGKAASEITGHLLRWLPWLALVSSQFLGLPTISFLLLQPLGWVLLAVAVALTFSAHFVANRLVSRITKVEPDPGLWLSLVSAALRQGAGINRIVGALRQVSGGALAVVEREVTEAMRHGGSVATRLDSEARRLRERAMTEKEQSVERFPIKLLLPLGLFLIPQFVLLLVGPVILTTIQGAHLVS